MRDLIWKALEHPEIRLKLVDRWGIEPQPSACKADVLPLSLSAQLYGRCGENRTLNLSRIRRVL